MTTTILSTDWVRTPDGRSWQRLVLVGAAPSIVKPTPTCDDVAQVVGEASIPCECRHCPPHRPGTHCTCDVAARWMVRIAHNAGSVEGGNVCGIVAPLCDVCFAVAKAWAVQSVAETDVCMFCGAPVRVASDLITSVVSLW